MALPLTADQITKVISLYTPEGSKIIAALRYKAVIIDDTEMAGAIQVATTDALGNINYHILINHDGKIGLGTLTPEARLHVDGNVKLENLDELGEEDVVNVVVRDADGFLKIKSLDSFAETDPIFAAWLATNPLADFITHDDTTELPTIELPSEELPSQQIIFDSEEIPEVGRQIVIEVSEDSTTYTWKLDETKVDHNNLLNFEEDRHRKMNYDEQLQVYLIED